MVVSLNPYKNYEDFLGTNDPLRLQPNTDGWLSLAREIREKLGGKGYLLDNYLAFVFEGLAHTKAMDAADAGNDAATVLWNAIRFVMAGDEEKGRKNPLYPQVREYIDAHSLVSHQKNQKIKFPGCQIHGNPVPFYKPCHNVNSQHAVCQHGLQLVASPEDHLHPGNQLDDFKGLGDIVLRPQVQTANSLIDRALGRQEDYRDLHRADIIHQLVPSSAGQHNIQQNQVKTLLLQEIRRGQAVFDLDTAIPLLFQIHRHKGRDIWLVLDNQDPDHACPFLITPTPSSYCDHCNTISPK